MGRDPGKKLAMIGLEEEDMQSALSSLSSHDLTETWVNYGDYFRNQQSSRYMGCQTNVYTTSTERHLEILYNLKHWQFLYILIAMSGVKNWKSQESNI